MKAGFAEVDGLPGVYAARAGKLSAFALRLRDGSLYLYSPVAGLEAVLRGQLDDLGPVTALLAPNHYHNKGLAAHVAAFPDARLYCSAKAHPRLTKITGLAFSPLDDLRSALDERHSLHAPDGLKTGEVWVQVDAGSERALIVTDAFNAPLGRPGSFGDEAGILGTFPRYGVQDAAAYKAWAVPFITAAAPSILMPCHGSPVKAPDLAAQLTRLLQDSF